MTPGSRVSVALACALLAACGQKDDGAGQDAAGAAASPTPVAAAQAGPTPPPAFAVCASCHSVTPGRHAAGPSLAGVWGRKAGSMDGFMYSPALKNAGITWDAQSLDRWLQGPMQMVPGTRMVVGLPDPAGRKAVIEYLEALK